MWSVRKHREGRTVQRDTRTIALDHFPVCGGCGDICGRLADICAGCGRELYPTVHALAVASRAMQAAPKGEAVPPANGSEA